MNEPFTSDTDSPSPSSFWARLWARLSGRQSPSPPPSPLPAPEPSPPSATLEPVEDPYAGAPEHVVRAIQLLEHLGQRIFDGDIQSFVLFVQNPKGVQRVWYNTGDGNPEQMALEIMDYGHQAHRAVVRRQGNAPPNNRSENEQ